jgi:hypothetical protein
MLVDPNINVVCLHECLDFEVVAKYTVLGHVAEVGLICSLPLFVGRSLAGERG